MKRSLWKRILTGVILLLLLIGIDQYTKLLAVRFLKNQPDLRIIPGIFRLTYVENFGAAFGTMENSRVFLLIANTILMLYIILVYIRLVRYQGHRLIRGCCLFILAGGLGNVIDRLIRGYVVDFFYFELIDFPVFNAADCYITCAIAVLLISMFTIYRNEDIELLIPFGKDDRHDDSGAD